MTEAVKPGGCAIIAAFAPDGPEWRSGLPVQRYDAQSLARTLGSALIETRTDARATPSGALQRFQFSLFRRQA